MAFCLVSPRSRNDSSHDTHRIKSHWIKAAERQQAINMLYVEILDRFGGPIEKPETHSDISILMLKVDPLNKLLRILLKLLLLDFDVWSATAIAAENILKII